MLKKLLNISIILLISMFFLNGVYASDILSSFNTTTSNQVTVTQNNNNNNVVETNLNTVTPNSNILDNTTYSSGDAMEDLSNPMDSFDDYEQAATTTTQDYESETELSISNMINIILIVVGIVLVLLGIAIIIKLK